MTLNSLKEYSPGCGSAADADWIYPTWSGSPNVRFITLPLSGCILLPFILFFLWIGEAPLQFNGTVSLLVSYRSFHGKHRQVKSSREEPSVNRLVKGMRPRFSRGSWTRLPVSGKDAAAPPWWPWSGRQRSGLEEMFPRAVEQTDTPRLKCLSGQEGL